VDPTENNPELQRKMSTRNSKEQTLTWLRPSIRDTNLSWWKQDI